MAYNSNRGKNSFIASAGQTIFTFNFKIFEDDELIVYLTPNGDDPDETSDILTLTTDYTVTITGDSGGSIELVNPASNGDTIVIIRSLPVDREIEYQTRGDLAANTLNEDQDYQTYLIADNNLVSDNAIKLPDNAVGVDTKLPNVVADGYIKFTNDGLGVETDDTVPQGAIDANDSSLNAGSWANEDEDVPVKEYTNGVPSNRAPEVFSAKHWAIKAEDAVIGDVEFRDTEWRVFDDLDNTKKVAFQVDGITTATTRTINMPDYDVVAGGIKDKEVDDTNIANNRILVYKTSSGKYELEDNIEPLEIASTAEAQAGTDNTKAITPLRLREGFNANDPAPVYACRAWIRFDGDVSGSPSIGGSGNISSITDNGVGDFTLNLTTPMKDANFCAVGMSGNSTNTAEGRTLYISSQAITSSSVRIKSVSNDTDTPQDDRYTNVAIFR